MKKLFGMGYSHFKELKSRGYTLDSMFILSLINDGVDTQSLGDEGVDLLVQGLERKNLVNGGKLTKLGVELLEYLGTRAGKLKVGKSQDKDFDKWWEVYPSTNFFSHKGREFKGLQTKRVKGTDCRALFNKYVTTGKYTAEEIIGATGYHIALAKDESITTGTNQLTYISNSHTYLLQEKFAPFIERWKSKGGKSSGSSSSKGAVDI